MNIGAFAVHEQDREEHSRKVSACENTIAKRMTAELLKLAKSMASYW